MNPWDLVVLGAGPAGLSAAIVARALGIHTVVLETEAHAGGQLRRNPTPIRDCPGLPADTGVALAARLIDHLDALGGTVRHGTTVTAVDLARRAVTVGHETVHGEHILVATGAQPRRLGVPGERDVPGRGPSPAAAQHGHRYAGRTVLVVGGGDVATEEAALFARHCDRVIVAHRASSFRGRADFRAAVMASPRIEVRWQTVLRAVEGEPEVTHAVLSGPCGVERVAVAGVFICAGLAPRSELFTGQLVLDGRGYVVTDTRQQTSMPGVYAAGDVCAGSAWTVAAALGQAAVAVKDIERRHG